MQAGVQRQDGHESITYADLNVVRAARQLYRRWFSLIALRLHATVGDCCGRPV